MSDKLRAAIERARNHKMAPQEKFLQRVSFCYGQQDYDNPNAWSKRRVAEFLAEQYGYPAEWAELVPAQGIEAAAAAKTPQSGLAEGESPVGNADAPNPYDRGDTPNV
jgi:hypothetical protein